MGSCRMPMTLSCRRDWTPADRLYRSSVQRRIDEITNLYQHHESLHISRHFHFPHRLSMCPADVHNKPDDGGKLYQSVLVSKSDNTMPSVRGLLSFRMTNC